MRRVRASTWFLVPALFLVSSSAFGQYYQYAVKFVCGAQSGEILAPGQYRTAINVHNPGTGVATVYKKFAIALPGEKAGAVTHYFRAPLQRDQAMEIDCADIWSHTNMHPGLFVKGFAVILSRTELDVVAVYTGANTNNQLQTMDVETIAPRRVTLPLEREVPKEVLGE